jgi:hypothetical protein
MPPQGAFAPLKKKGHVPVTLFFHFCITFSGTMPTIPPATLRLINLADLLREEACVRLGGEDLPDPPGEPGQW